MPKDAASKKRLELEPGRDPWDAQPGESRTMFERFTQYRDAGLKRSVRAIAEAAGKSTQYMQQVAYRNHWHARAAAYDAEQRRLRGLRLEAERDRMVDDHIKIARAMLVKAAQGLNALDATKLTATEIVRMVETLAKLERAALGEPERTVAVQGGGFGTPPIQITAVPADEAERVEMLRGALERIQRMAGDEEGILGDVDLFELEDAS
ncbi:hypothetical protein ACFC1T_09535 [Kitasatospora sp. NPDC056076]|uniref:hypothetical protein n=1 Tax=Kitasatospora sp. NPDC056076 TaxID=3345703 RepID=UPI0035DBF1F4